MSQLSTLLWFLSNLLKLLWLSKKFMFCFVIFKAKQKLLDNFWVCVRAEREREGVCEWERDWALSKQSIFLQRISEKVAFISLELVPFEQRNSEEKKNQILQRYDWEISLKGVFMILQQKFILRSFLSSILTLRIFLSQILQKFNLLKLNP